MSVPRLIRQFFPYLWEQRALAACTLLFLIVSPAFSVASLKLMASVVDQVFVGGHIALLPWFLAGLFLLQIARFVMSRTEQRVDLLVSERISIAIKGSLYRSIIAKPPGAGPTLATGEVLSHLTSDVSGAEYIVYTGMIGVIDNVARIFVYGALLFVLSVKLTLCAFLFLPLLAIPSTRGAVVFKRLARITRRRRSRALGITEERLSARPIIVACGTEQQETDDYIARCKSILNMQLRSLNIEIQLSGVFELIGASVGLVLLAIGAVEVHSHHMTTGSLLAYLGSLGSLYGPAKSFAKSRGRFQRAGVSAERIAHLLEDTTSPAAPRAPSALVPLRGAIEFRNVSFAYQQDEKVLRNISFSLQQGEKVALVGASGSGKTTLLRLILRFCDPLEGSVLLDGVDARTMSPIELRRRIANVFQESYLFRTTIAENIKYGAPHATLDDIKKAIQSSQAQSFVERMPHGLHTKIGNRGESLSGGQKQRLALARALARNADILLLDEPTSSLDSQTEAMLNGALLSATRQKTVVTVAHRLSSVMASDRILVLDNGEIVEDGAPSRLLYTDTRCRELFQAQLDNWKISA